MLIIFYQIFLVVAFAFFAAVLASFFNVVIYRTVKEESFVKGRSYCESCKKEIAWYDNIPILSFLFLRGKCRHCHKKIKPSYFWTEVLAAVYSLIFIFVVYSGQLFSTLEIWQIVFYFLFFLILIFVVISDLQYLIIPDLFTALLLVLVITHQFLAGASWLSSLIAVIFSLILFLTILIVAKKIYKKDALGMGDIKLMLPFSILLAWPMTVMAVFLSFIIGGFFAMLVLLTGKKKLGQALAFGPFLFVGFTTALFWGTQLWSWYWNLLI